MVDWYLGTIGFTYPEWKGSFYPSGLPASQALSYYSRVFNAVEINTTFYGPQPPAQLQRWVASTPEDFRFCMKTPRRITHDLRLQAPAGQEMRAFVDASLALGAKLGAFLVQLPPSFTASDFEPLTAFLQALPAGTAYAGARYAVEFRHPSWHTPEVADRLQAALQKHGVGWVATDYEDLPAQIHPTGDFLYIRWIGKHGVIPHPGREVIDRGPRLQDWLALLRAHLESVAAIFGFFDNDYAGHAPATCNRFKELVGLPVASSQAGEQGRLF